MNILSNSLIAAAVAAAAVFVLDLFIPLGVAVPMLYALPILFSRMVPGRRITLVMAGSCIILTLLGIALSSGEFTTAVAADRALASMLLLIIAALVVRQKQSAAQITEAQREKYESEERLRLALEGAELGMWDINVRTHETIWNHRHKLLQGYSPNFSPPSLQAWKDRVHPDDRDRVMAQIEQAQSSRGLFSSEHRVVDGDGHEIRWLSLYGRFSYDETGEPLRFNGVSLDITERKQTEAQLSQLNASLELRVAERTDELTRMNERLQAEITERKQAEEQFRLAVESAPNGILMANQEGVITLVNTQVERWFRYDRHEIVGRPIEMLLPERFRSQHHGQRTAFYHDPKARAMGAGRDLFGRRKDGSEFPLEIGLSPIKTSQGTQVLAAIVDISTRKQAEESLREAAHALAAKNLKLQRANETVLTATRAKSEFLASMSHEIRTPMNAIIAMADLLQETPLSTEQLEYVNRFSRATTNLLDLINNILDISKIETGHLELESVAFDIHDLVDEIAGLMAIRSSDKQLELEAFVHPDVPTWVLGDPTRLRQIFVNLVGNAIKFTEQGEVVIRIEPDKAMPGTLHCSVSDTGIGIPADKIDSIFESFNQVDSSTTRKYGGSGLGLSISKHLVTLMGGDLTVTSVIGRGSAFSFTLHFEAAAPPAHTSPVPAINLRNHRILVVDDLETNRMIVREYLKPLGPELGEASDAPSALEALNTALKQGMPFDLVILSHHMPKLDGLGLAQTIREGKDGGSLPLIMYASDLRGRAVQRARELGIVSHLYKPICRMRLLESLAIALNQGRPSPTQNKPDAPLALPALPPRHILLVEDLEDNREIVALLLKGTACRLDVAENGAVGLQKVQTGAYDMVFMDMQMPVMDGLQATAAIRRWECEQHRTPTPIIALTANAFKEEADKSLAAGCTAHVAKPIKKKTLLATIAQYATTSNDRAA
ncbi:MAG: response regulator [Nitrospira sp.]|nr:response regulator [Nitrospira sp.]